MGRVSRAVLDVLLVGLGIVTVWRLAGPSLRSFLPAAENPSLQIGDKLNIDSIEWADASRHVVLMLSTTCSWCARSADWYATISRQLSAADPIHIAVVTGETVEVMAKWLGDRHIVVDEVVSLPDPAGAGFSETPTVVVVNSAGQVTDAVLGKLDQAQERHLLARVIEPGTSGALTNIPKEIDRGLMEDRRATDSSLQLVDIRERDQYTDRTRRAIAMPFDELETRAPIELVRQKPLIVDCAARRLGECRAAARLLMALGFADVVVGRP